jgi:hypothetical protein
VGAAVVGDAVGDGVVGDPVGEAVVGDCVLHSVSVHTTYWLYWQPCPAHDRSHITSPKPSHNAPACANVYGRGGTPATQPISSFGPT